MKVFLAGNGLWQTREIYGSLIEKYHPYRLESFYYANAELERLIPMYADFLLDSGAFTFMSNAHRKCDWDDYIKRYADFIIRNNIRRFFELDIDSVVGYKAVLKYRDKLESMTGRPCIPVWHKSRGYADFIDTCRRYDYVAIGGIVTGEIKRADYPVFSRLISDASKLGCKLHGLGFTKLTLLDKYHFYSVDSSSWQTGNRFGFIYHFDGKTMQKTDAPPGSPDRRPPPRRTAQLRAMVQIRGVRKNTF